MVNRWDKIDENRDVPFLERRGKGKGI